MAMTMKLKNLFLMNKTLFLNLAKVSNLRKVIVLFTSLAFSQEYTVQGTVRSLERTTGKKLVYVKIDVDSGSYMTITDSTGNFSLKVPNGVHNIRVSKFGYIGFIRQGFDLKSDTTFNVSLPDTLQESPDSTQRLFVNQYRELNRSNQTYPNSLTWNGVTEGNLIQVYLRNATSFDSLTFKNAIGLANGDWQNSPANSVEKKQKRAIYQLSSNSAIGTPGGPKGIRVNFNAGSTFTTIGAYEDNPAYIKASTVNLAATDENIIQKEIFGRAFAKGDVTSRSSYMNGHSAGVTDLDHMLNFVFFNHWAAMYRGEQDATMFDMEEYKSFPKPNVVSITYPANNSSSVPLDNIMRWSNSVGTDFYRLQISKDSNFANIVFDDSLIQRIDRQFKSAPGTKYFARVQAMNDSGVSDWSVPVSFASWKNTPPSTFAFSSVVPDTVRDWNDTSKFNWQKSVDVDNQNVTYGYRLVGGKLDSTFNTADTSAVISAKILEPNTNYVLSGFATDGIDTTYASNTLSFSTADHLTPVKKEDTIQPMDFEIKQNFPNPFNPTTSISFSLPKNMHVLLRIFDVLGREVATLENEVKNVGRYTVEWNASSVSSGIYFYKFEAGSYVSVKRMVLLK